MNEIGFQTLNDIELLFYSSSSKDFFKNRFSDSFLVMTAAIEKSLDSISLNWVFFEYAMESIERGSSTSESLFDQNVNDVWAINRWTIIIPQQPTTFKQFLKGFLWEGMLALVGMNNSGDTTESSHAVLTSNLLEHLDQSLVSLFHNKLNHFVNLLRSKGLSERLIDRRSQNSHKWFAALCMLMMMLPSLIKIMKFFKKCFILTEIEIECRSRVLCGLLEQLLLHSDSFSHHLFITHTDIFPSLSLFTFLAYFAPLLYFLGLEFYSPFVAELTGQSKHWI